MEKRVVMAFGTFTVIHPGHLRYLEFAKSHGDKLIVVVARDENVVEEKGNCPVPEEHRLEIVKALKIVDEAVLGHGNDRVRIIREMKPDVIALGPDQKADEKLLKREFSNTEVVRMKSLAEGGLKKSRSIVEKIGREYERISLP
jgi:FAD synthetase